MTNKFGAVDWDDIEFNNNKSFKNDRDLYLKLQSGSNVIRIITKPHEFLCHQYKSDPRDPGFGNRVMSSLFHGTDYLTETKSLKPKRRWLVGVIDRKTNSYKILDMSQSVFKAVQNFARSEDWGDPQKYDLEIIVDKNGGPTGYYTVIPKPMKPLSPSDLEIKQSVDLEDLKRRCLPLSYEEMKKRVELIDSKSQFLKSTKSAKTNNQPSSSSPAADEYEFPVVDGSAE